MMKLSMSMWAAAGILASTLMTAETAEAGGFVKELRRAAKSRVSRARSRAPQARRIRTPSRSKRIVRNLRTRSASTHRVRGVQPRGRRVVQQRGRTLVKSRVATRSLRRETLDPRRPHGINTRHAVYTPKAVNGRYGVPKTFPKNYRYGTTTQRLAPGRGLVSNRMPDRGPTMLQQWAQHNRQVTRNANPNAPITNGFFGRRGQHGFQATNSHQARQAYNVRQYRQPRMPNKFQLQNSRR